MTKAPKFLWIVTLVWCSILSATPVPQAAVCPAISEVALYVEP